MKFSVKGHENILATHRATIEFTKESHLSKAGDCIVGIEADFDPAKLKQIVKRFNSIEIILTADGHTDLLTADINKDFDDPHEIVIRRTSFISQRTLGIHASKTAFEINRQIVKHLQEGGSATIIIRGTK